MCKGSSIVLVSRAEAISSLEPGGIVSARAATCGAIDAMVVHFAAMLGERGIRINAVTPGMHPPEEVARTIVFLSSNDARWMTGETFRSNARSALLSST